MHKALKDKEGIFFTTIAISFVLLVHNGTEPLFLIAYSFIPILILLFYYKKSLIPLIIYLLLISVLGKYTRYIRENYASDVLLGIHDWIGYLLSGRNIYNESIFTQTGLIPFVYMPFSILWYLPARLLNIDLRFFEMIISSLVPIEIFLYGKITKNWKILPLLSVIALTPFLLDLSADGSNDNSAIFILLLSIVSFIYSRKNKSKIFALISAVILGLALSFKQYVLFYAVFLIPFFILNKNYLPISFKKYLLFAFISFAAISLPFILASPNGFYQNILYIETAKNRSLWGWNLWVALKILFNLKLTMQQIWIARTVLTLSALFGFIRFFKMSQYRHVLIAASITMLVYLSLSPWTTYAYFTFLVPLICLSAIEIE